MPDGGTVDSIVNAASKAWDIVKDNKPSASAKGSFCQAIPGNYAFNKISGWKKESQAWSANYSNLFGVETVSIDFELDYQWGGQIEGVSGMFLTNFNVFCKNIDVLWGYTVNVDATVSGNAFNSGSKEVPVGAIPLVVSWQVETVLMSKSKSVKLTAHGNKALQVS
jgi:hypothetical protein